MSVHPGERYIVPGESNMFDMPSEFQPSFDAAHPILQQVANDKFTLHGQVKTYATEGQPVEQFQLGPADDYRSAADSGYALTLRRCRDGKVSAHRITCIPGSALDRTANAYGIMTYDETKPGGMSPATLDELLDVASAVSQIATAYPEATEYDGPNTNKSAFQRLSAKILRRYVQ